MLDQNIDLVLLLELVSFAVAMFFALVLYLSARRFRDILLHQRSWLLQSGKKEVPMMLGGFAVVFWFLSAVSSVAGLWLSSYCGAALYGSVDPGGFGAFIAAVVGLLAICAGIRDAGAKWRESLWNYVAIATHINNKEDLRNERIKAGLLASGA